MQFYQYADTDISCGNISAVMNRYDKFNLLSLTMLQLLVNRLGWTMGTRAYAATLLPRQYNFEQAPMETQPRWED